MIKQFAQSRKIWVFFGVIDVLLAGIFLSLSFKKNDKIININSSSNIDYFVHLNENNFYETDILPGDMEYVASLIKDIDTNLKYTINSTEKMDYEYTYSIDAIARVYGDKAKDNILFEKKENIKPETTVKAKGKNEAVIFENIKVDYNKYNDLIALFKSSYLLESTSDVKVVLHVKANISNMEINEKTSFEDDLVLIVPLTEQTVNIKISEQPAGVYKVIEHTNKIIYSYSRFWVSIALFILSIISLIMYIFDVGGLDKATHNYKKRLNQILRDYDLIIVNMTKAFDESGYKIIEVTSFDELKDVHDNIGNPILFKEVQNNKLSIFLINENDTLYKYCLKK